MLFSLTSFICTVMHKKRQGIESAGSYQYELMVFYLGYKYMYGADHDDNYPDCH